MRRLIASLFLIAFAASPAFSQAADFSGTWQRQDGSIILIDVAENVLTAWMDEPSPSATSTYGWSKGDVLFQANLDGTVGTGVRHYRFPLETGSRCPATRGASGSMQLIFKGDDVFEIGWQNGLLESDCSISAGPQVTETFTRLVTPVPDNGTLPELPKPVASAETLDEETLLGICPPCLELAVEFLAQKAAYPVLKQDWLDLKAQRDAIGDEAKLGRMRAELAELEAALAPLPPGPPPGAIESWLEQFRKGWRWHSYAFFGGDTGSGADPVRGVVAVRDYIATWLGFDGYREWAIDRNTRYDLESGERLTEEDRRIIAEARAAARALERQMRQRSRFLSSQLDFAAYLEKRIVEAEAAIDALERRVLDTLPALNACLRSCTP